MDLAEFTSPLPKEWLNIKCNSLETAMPPVVPSLTVPEVTSVPNPSVGDATIWVNNSGVLSTTDGLGDVNTYESVADADARFLQLLGGTMTGDISMNTIHNITNIQNLSGTTVSRNANNIVANVGTSTDTDIAIFSGTTGKVITDSGIPISAISGGPYLPLAGGTMSGNVDFGTNNINNVGTIGGVSAGPHNVDDLVTTPGGVGGNLPVYSSSTILVDSTIAPSSLLSKSGGTMTGDIVLATHNLTNVGSLSGATNSYTVDNLVDCLNGSATVGNVATFSNINAREIHDSGVAISTLSGGPFLPTAGGTMSGAIAMGAQNITNVASLSGASNTRTADNIVSNSGSATSGNLASFSGASGKVITDSGVLFSNVGLSAYSMTTGAAAITGTTSQLTFLSAGLGSLTFPANSTQKGTVLHIHSMIQYTIIDTNSLSFFVVDTTTTDSFSMSVTNSSGSTQTNARAVHDIWIYINSDAVVQYNWVTYLSTSSTPIITTGTANPFWNGSGSTNVLDFQGAFSSNSGTNLAFPNTFSISRVY